jgi:hypothetical protein
MPPLPPAKNRAKQCTGCKKGPQQPLCSFSLCLTCCITLPPPAHLPKEFKCAEPTHAPAIIKPQDIPPGLKMCVVCRTSTASTLCTDFLCLGCCTTIPLPPHRPKDQLCADPTHATTFSLLRSKLPVGAPHHVPVGDGDVVDRGSSSSGLVLPSVIQPTHSVGDIPSRNLPAFVSCKFDNCTAIIRGGVSCPSCQMHCTTPDCAESGHTEFRRLSILASSCKYSRTQVVTRFLDCVCPCGRTIQDHPMGSDTTHSARTEDEHRLLQVPPPPAGYSAKDFGIPQKMFAVHPVSLTGADWKVLLSHIRGRSDMDRKFDEVTKLAKTKSTVKKSDADVDLSIGRLLMECELPGGTLVEFAGLLATLSAITSFNLSMSSSPSSQIVVAQAALTEGRLSLAYRKRAVSGWCPL